MDKRNYLVILYDYYGALLNEDNKKYFEDYYFDNLSLGEIAINSGVSRNAVHKHIKSTEAKLLFYENKLKLYEKEEKLKGVLKKINDASVRDEIINIFS